MNIPLLGESAAAAQKLRRAPLQGVGRRQKYRVRIRSFVHAGVGFAQKPFSEQSLQPEAIALMRSIKRAFDPENILNPGEFFD